MRLVSVYDEIINEVLKDYKILCVNFEVKFLLFMSKLRLDRYFWFRLNQGTAMKDFDKQ